MDQLFFFDIDGTLIECNKDIFTIETDVRDALSQLQKHNHGCFLATGRCKCFIVDGVMDYPFDGYVTCNGAYVEYNGKEVYKKVIPSKAIRKTHELCLKRNMAYYFEGNDSIYILNRTNPKHVEFRDNWHMKEEVIVDEFDIENIETYIGMIVVNSDEDIQEMVQELSPYFDIQRHQSDYSFDLTLKGESKAKGIRKLCKVLNKDMKNTIAFGDGRNDIEMLENVQLGIAMGNAAIEAKAVANYITDDIDKKGIIHALKHYEYL